MQNSILQKYVWKVILILLLTFCFYFLSKNGVLPEHASIGEIPEEEEHLEAVCNIAA